jgi:hypothetical protein
MDCLAAGRMSGNRQIRQMWSFLQVRFGISGWQLSGAVCHASRCFREPSCVVSVHLLPSGCHASILEAFRCAAEMTM